MADHWVRPATGREIVPASGEPDRAPVVTHGPPRERVIMRDYPQAPSWDMAPVVIDQVWTPATGQVQEIGTPVSRALATILRALPIVVLLLPITAAGCWWLGVLFYEWVLIFAGSGLAAYLFTVWLDLSHNSPGSVERHRINAAAGLKRLELLQGHELRRAALESYLEALERDR